MVWAGGFLLAVALYVIGPDRFFDACLNLMNGIDAAFRNLVAELGVKTYGVVRAFAIAIYAVFGVLAFLAARRGHRGIGALIVVSVMFLLLVWRPWGIYPAPLSRWMAALILVVAAAIIMTQRLTTMPSHRKGQLPPYPPGSAP